jgi:hypothetical protein
MLVAGPVGRRRARSFFERVRRDESGRGRMSVGSQAADSDDGSRVDGQRAVQRARS